MAELLRRSGTSPNLINAASLEREMSDAVRTGCEQSLEIALAFAPCTSVLLRASLETSSGFWHLLPLSFTPPICTSRLQPIQHAWRRFNHHAQWRK